MSRCRGCGEYRTAAGFSISGKCLRPTTSRSRRIRCARTRHRIRWRWTCARACGLAQLADDDTVTDEPRGVEPQALRDQAEDAIERVAAAGWLRGDDGASNSAARTVAPGSRCSPSAGSPRRRRTQTWCWTASASCTNPTSAAPSRGAPSATDPDGVLLLQYHSIVTIVGQGQWNALRHGHFAYYSLTTLIAAARCGRHERGHRVGVRPVRRNGAGCRRAR